MDEKVVLDELDEKILAELAANSRESYRKLAVAVKAAPATVIQRVKRLEESGVIRGYGVKLDYVKLGFEYVGVTEITIRKGALLDVQRQIAFMPGVVSVFDVTGQSDSVVVSRCRSRGEFSKLVKKILAIENVERTNTHIVLNVLKENGEMAGEFEKKKATRS
ncbi:hypothetical protein AUJ14_00350 [Candidatus Micrarchaeota archaeon CG1_02_55_22]|nr:MAG: hypothetical protein AUJ14_00350 [Candidatus Micrarchaeota archaeon CG1_02_55_22]